MLFIPSSSSSKNTNHQFIASEAQWIYDPEIMMKMAPWHRKQYVADQKEAQQLGLQGTWLGVYDFDLKKMRLGTLKGTRTIWTYEKVWDMLPMEKQNELFQHSYRQYKQIFDLLIKDVHLPPLPTFDILKQGWKKIHDYS
jgi:hypothetical protein